MNQHRSESENTFVRQPCVDYIGSSLKLFNGRAHSKSAAFQLDGRNIGGAFFFSDEQVIATLAGLRNAQALAIQIDYHATCRSLVHGYATSLFAASLHLAFCGNGAGNSLYYLSTHALPSSIN